MLHRKRASTDQKKFGTTELDVVSLLTIINKLAAKSKFYSRYPNYASHSVAPYFRIEEETPGGIEEGLISRSRRDWSGAGHGPTRKFLACPKSRNQLGSRML
jgi:hypothetical protein